MSNVVQKPKMPEFLWVTRSGFNKCLLGMNLSVIHIVGVVKKNLNFKIVCMSQSSYKFLITQIPTARKVNIFRTFVSVYLKLDNFVVNKKLNQGYKQLRYLVVVNTLIKWETTKPNAAHSSPRRFVFWKKRAVFYGWKTSHFRQFLKKTTTNGCPLLMWNRTNR